MTALYRNPRFILLLLLSALLIQPVTGAPLDRATLEAAVEDPTRDIQDRMRDEQRQPAAVLEFLQLEPGMQVLDVYAAGGYYSHILSRAVGLRGTVYAQNAPRSLNYDQDRSELSEDDALNQAIERGQLLNIQRIDRGIGEMNLPDDSLDLVLVSQILHDYYNRSPRRAENVLGVVYRALKPGGVMGIIDHDGREGANNERLHRMPKARAIEVAQRAGFVLEAESDILSVPEDSLRRSIFDPMLRQSDQFLLRFRKPPLP